MKKFIAVAVSVAALVAVAPATAPASSTDAQAQIACQNAVIGGKRKCIARGQYCARRHQRDYRRYGYSCSKRDRNGRYHLV